MTLANAHPLFCGLRAEPSYLANLAVHDNERQALIEARDKVRAALRAAAHNLNLRDEYWQDTETRKVTASTRPVASVKFMTQGSFAYATLNAPAQSPAQEIDLDDGMYVPVRFLENGRPALAAKGLYIFVESVLKPLCEQNKWSLDNDKDCCIRVKLWPGAHIDLPMYSIPDDRFAALRESMRKTATASLTRDSIRGEWKLPSDQIMLAKRDGSWTASDPQLLQDWVRDRIDRYGAVYRRLSRFFKGWRDHTWEKPRLSSLCIMRSVDIALGQLDGLPTEARDDELVMEVAKLLPTIFAGNVENPVLRGLHLNEWSDDDRADIIAGVTTLRDSMVSALEGTANADLVVKKLRDGFGGRLPYRPDYVKIGSQIEAVEKLVPATVAAPRMIPSTSG